MPGARCPSRCARGCTMSRDESDVSGAWVATAPASAMHRRVTFAAMILLLLAFAAAATFAKVPLPASSGFVPFIQAMVFLADLVTAILLFTQTAITRRRGLLVLANAYYFVALVVFTHTLVFPGAFAPA